jgi:hypothetical protein
MVENYPAFRLAMFHRAYVPDVERTRLLQQADAALSEQFYFNVAVVVHHWALGNPTKQNCLESKWLRMIGWVFRLFWC